MGRIRHLRGGLGSTTLCKSHLLLLQSLIKQANSHLNVRRRTSNRHQPLITTSTSSNTRTRFHDLDMTRRHASNLVNLGTAFTDDATDEVVRDEDLLGLRTGWELWCTCTCAYCGTGSTTKGWSGSAVAEGLLGSGVGVGRCRRTSGGSTGSGTVRKVVGVTILVLEKDGSDVVDGNVNGIGNTRDGENTLSGAGKHGFTSGETGTGSFLDLLDLGTLLANDGAHARVGYNETDGDRLGARNRGLVERLVVNSSDNETKGLRKSRRDVRVSLMLSL